MPTTTGYFLIALGAFFPTLFAYLGVKSSFRLAAAFRRGQFHQLVFVGKPSHHREPDGLTERMAPKVKPRRGLTLTLCVTTMILILVYVFVSDATIWGEWLSIGPPVLWAAVLVPSVMRSKSRLAAFFLLAFLWITTEWPRFGTNAIAVHDSTIRLVSWNIGAGNGN